MRHLGAGHGPPGNVYLSEANSHGTFASCSMLHLSTITLLKAEGFKEQPCVIWGVIASIHVIVVQGETVGPRATVIRVKNNEVDYLLTHHEFELHRPSNKGTKLLLKVIKSNHHPDVLDYRSVQYAAKTPSIRGPFQEDVMPNELLTCGVEECKHGGVWWYGYRSEVRGGEYE